RRRARVDGDRAGRAGLAAGRGRRERAAPRDARVGQPERRQARDAVDEVGVERQLVHAGESRDRAARERAVRRDRDVVAEGAEACDRVAERVLRGERIRAGERDAVRLRAGEREREGGQRARGDGERGRVHGGERAVGEVQGRGVGGVVEAEVGEGGDAGDRGLGQRALQRTGAGAERDGHGRGVACDGVAELVLDRDGRLGAEDGAGGGGAGLRGHGELVGGGGGDGEGGGVGEGEGAVGETERL